MNMPGLDFEIKFFAAAFNAEHGRFPVVTDLPVGMQERVGKLVFEYADYRDEHAPHWPDSLVYEAVMDDHWLGTLRPNGTDCSSFLLDYGLARQSGNNHEHSVEFAKDMEYSRSHRGGTK
jgi:hypothetical protein